MRRALALAVAVAGLAVPSASLARELRVGRDAPTIQATLDLAADGDVVVVPPGTYREHLRVERRVTLRGRGATVDGGGEGKVLVIAAAHAVVEGLSVRGSGADLGGPDTCIYLEPSATHATVRGCALEDCAFGIWVHEADHAKILDNRVRGRANVRESDRGNGIHLFDASYLEVRGNVVTGARDGIYVSATDDSVIAGNRVERQRYGVHYMYSHRNVIRDNVATHNLGGIALMQSRELTVTGNVATDNRRTGLLFRDAQACEIRRNRLERNGQGLFFFSSTDNVIGDNHVVHNDVGAKVWAGSLRNAVTGNAFVGNRQQIFYVGAEDLEWGVSRRGNYWSDYTGWDQDGDGAGDRPYRVDGFTAGLLYRHPSAVLLLRSPALELLTHLEARMPLLRVPTILDRAPLMRAPEALP